MEVYINVKKFGKISEARINISNFTVFVGNNNSGKTQLMELIYAVIKRLSELMPKITFDKIDDIDAYYIRKNEIEKLVSYANGYLKDNINRIIESAFNASIPIEQVSIEVDNIDLDYEIYFLTSKTVNYLFSKNIVDDSVLAESLQNNEQIYTALRVKHMGEITEVVKKNRFSNSIPIEFAKAIELGCVLADILGGESPTSNNLLFLPASRMGLMLLYKHYFGNENDKEKMIRDKNQNSKGITKPVLDFLSFLLKHSYTEKVAKENRELIDFISNNLIDGRINERGDMPTYTPNDSGIEIPMFVSSSMVNEIVPIIKALTDSDKINYIFYDEVETSLHPLKQIEMVKLLNRLNNKGIRLIVSTHSDTMATKINNLMLLSNLAEDFDKVKEDLEKKGVNIEKEDFLISKDIHIYQFVNDGKGHSKVEELEFKRTPYIGYEFSLFNGSSYNLFEEAKVAIGVDNED